MRRPPPPRRADCDRVGVRAGRVRGHTVGVGTSRLSTHSSSPYPICPAFICSRVSIRIIRIKGVVRYIKRMTVRTITSRISRMCMAPRTSRRPAMIMSRHLTRRQSMRRSPARIPRSIRTPRGKQEPILNLLPCSS